MFTCLHVAEFTKASKKLLELNVWERIRHCFLMERRSVLWIASQEWAPSRPTVTRAVSMGITVRDEQGGAHQKPPITSLAPSVQSVMRASEGAARVLSVVQAAASGDGQTAAQSAGHPLQLPPAKKKGRRAEPEQPGPADASAADGITPTTVLRELARFDGAETLAEEITMLREGKATAYEVLMLARAMVADGRIIQGKIATALATLKFDTPVDILFAVKINSAISLAADRATRVVQRSLELERELLGDPRDATGATGAPGEVFAMTSEEASAELRRCSHVAERYGLGFTVGGRAEIPVTVVTDEQDASKEHPSVFVGAHDEGPDEDEQDIHADKRRDK